MSIPLEVRQELWAWRYGEEAFTDCKEACDFILKIRLRDNSQIYHALNIAAVVCYARAFGPVEGTPKLSSDIIPRRYLSLHREIMEFAQRACTHTDAVTKGPPGELACEVIYFSAPGVQRVMTLQHNLKTDRIRKILDLSSLLAQICAHSIRSLMSEYESEFPKALGSYLLGVDGGSPDFEKVQREGMWVNQ